MNYAVETGKYLPLADEKYVYIPIISYYDRKESCMKYKYMKIDRNLIKNSRAVKGAISLALALVMTFSLAGCGKDNSKNTLEVDGVTIQQYVGNDGDNLYKVTLADGSVRVLDESQLAEVLGGQKGEDAVVEPTVVPTVAPTEAPIDEIEKPVDVKVILDKEGYETLCQNFINEFRTRGINENVLSDDVIRQAVAVFNIEILAPEVLEEIRDGRDGSQYLTEAMSVMGYGSDYNRTYYNKNHNTDGFINFSVAFPEGSYGYNCLVLTEEYRDMCSSVVNCQPLENFKDENGITHELYEVVDAETARKAYNTIIVQFLSELHDYDGKLYGVNNRGCGMAMVLPMFDMTETISRAGAFSPMLINDQNYAQMHASMTMEGPGSVVRNIYDGACYTPTNTTYTGPTRNGSYTRKRVIGR